MVRFAAIAAAAVLLAAMPAAAVAARQANPFLPQPQQQAPQEQVPAPAPAPAPTSGQPESDGISHGTQVLLVVGAIGLIGGIWFVIARDAQRATAGRIRTQTARSDPDADERRSSRPPSRGRKPSPAERRRRKRGRAR